MSGKRLGIKELGSSFACANVYIGALVGPALVAGTYAVTFFLPAGCNSLWTPFVACGIVALMCVFAAEIIREFKTYDYGSAANVIYGGNKILMGIFEIYIILSNVVGCAIVQSMSGTFCRELFGFPPLVGMIIMAGISLIMIYFRDKMIRFMNSIMSVVMMIGFIVISVLVIILYGEKLMEVLSGWYVPETSTPGQMWNNIRIFAFGSTGFAITLCCVEQPIKKFRQSVWIGIFTTICGGIMMALSCFTFLPFIGEVLGNPVPLVYIMDNYISGYFGWIPTVYYIIMLLAILSSIVPGCYMISSRWQNILPDRGFVKERSKEFCGNRNNMIMAVIYLVVCTGISMLGLSTVLNYGLNIISYIGIPLVCIPIFLIWPFKLYKRRKNAGEKK